MPVTKFFSRTSISHRIADFCHHLRNNGIATAPIDTARCLIVLKLINANEHQEVRLALKSFFMKNREDFNRFDELFDSFWFNERKQRHEHEAIDRNKIQTINSKTSPSIFETSGPSKNDKIDVPDNDKDQEADSSGDGKMIAAKTFNKMTTDMREFVQAEDENEATIIAQRIANAIRYRLSRRRKLSKKGASLDLRRIMRKSISTDGEPLNLLRKRRPETPMHLIGLIDVSGSMQPYARVFLSFIKGLIGNDLRTDAFLFHTKLMCVSDALRDNNTLRAANRLSMMAKGFGGGTKIGTCLNDFNKQFLGRILGRKSLVIVMSDGYDTDDPSILGSSLKRLKKSGCKLIWLNPLLGWKNYEPVNASITTALPYLDLFAPCNTLQSFLALENELRIL